MPLPIHGDHHSCEAPTTREQVIYYQGCAIQPTTAMEDAMTTMGWAVVLLVCKQPRRHPLA